MGRLSWSRDQVNAGGYVIHCLEAALWSVGGSPNFRDAVLRAANLGQDADTTAAVAWQLAGALYGASGIPETWLQKLAWRSEITELADQLFDAANSKSARSLPSGLESEIPASRRASRIRSGLLRSSQSRDGDASESSSVPARRERPSMAATGTVISTRTSMPFVTGVRRHWSA